MKAVIISAYGNADVMAVAQRAVPEIGATEVLIRNMATSISPVDIAFREGKPVFSRIFSGLSRPKYEIPGDIISGFIEKKGKAVTRFEIGDRVFGHASSSFGAQGQYLALDINEAIVKMPDEMSYEAGAAFAYSGMAAMPFMEEQDQLTPASKVLINGASGAIGTFAIQFAKLQGAHVTAVCSGNNTQLVESLGADAIIDYTSNEFTMMDQSYDFILDAIGKSGFEKCQPVLNPGGIYLSTMPTLGLMLQTVLKMKTQTKSGRFVATGLRKPEQKRQDLKRLAQLFEEGKLRAVIGREFAMDEIVAAHRYVESGSKQGNTILKMM